MSVVYNQTAINARLQGVVSTIDEAGQGFLHLTSNGSVVSTIQLAMPCGTVNGGVLTFIGTLVDPAAAGTGVVDKANITDGAGSVIVSCLTVGISMAQADILISNGLSSTLISSGQTVQLLSAQITGS